MVYRFDRFEVDDREFRLSEDGTPVQVEPKALRLLLYLIENRNRLVRKQELLDAVWHDAMVTENALTRVIALLRKALNENSHIPRYIETVPTAGYRFIANVTMVEENPATRVATQTPSIAAPAEHRTGARTPNSLDCRAGRPVSDRHRRHIPVPPSRQKDPHREGHDRARRLRQLYRRSGVRRHAAARHGGATRAVSIPEPHPG